MKSLIAAIAISLALVPAAFASRTTTYFVRHKDPGCHWLVKKGTTKRLSNVTVKGAVRLVNQDIGTQVILTPMGDVVRVKPGSSATLSTKGIYFERMTGQMDDDNTDVIIIK